MGENFVITFQERPGDVFESIRARLHNAHSKIRRFGADYLAHALIDVTVDSYFSIIETIGDLVSEIEENIVSDPGKGNMQKIHMLKREIIFLRKSVWPIREIVSGLQRKTTPLIKEETLIYLKDVYDHTIQVIDTIETYRDILGGMLDLYISSVSNRMNEIMKVLTIFASIFIPLTFITGLYGMNFNPEISPFNMPELDWHFGYFFALGLMGLIALIMLIYFKRKNWF